MPSINLKKLKKYGYSRQNISKLEKDNRTIYKKNYKGMSLNRSILEFAEIKECNFDYASITGSIYRNCSFTDNSMHESDFEFCEFSNCNFQNKSPINCSYNNSNFINSRFFDVTFDACTFTSAYFEDCQFNSGKIKYSTLENSVFKDCSFNNMDLRNLNMDFVELSNPHMTNVVLPMAQIPFMYGCLNYLLETKDDVKISKGKDAVISIQEYLEKVIPLMKKYFIESKQYFPLSNIYIALKEYEAATQALKNGLSIAVENRDFRMLKYYCFLIAKSGCFHPDTLHMFYNNICRLSPQGTDSMNELKNYTRHIGEIRAILFDQTSISSLNMTIRTDIQSKQISNLSRILESIFSISKTDIGYGRNQVEILITENSPLIIELRVSGDENGLICLLTAMTKLLNVEEKANLFFPYIDTDNNCIQQLYEKSEEYSRIIRSYSVTLTLVEYYLGNFRKNCFKDIPCYYYNSSACNTLYSALLT